MEQIARLRTIKKSLLELKQADPNTCITENYIRAAIRAGTIRSIRAGNRALLDMSELENLIERASQPNIAPATTGIRRISSEVRP